MESDSKCDHRRSAIGDNGDTLGVHAHPADERLRAGHQAGGRHHRAAERRLHQGERHDRGDGGRQGARLLLRPRLWARDHPGAGNN
eukprot:1195539-Prorocentrum_minimum.AAC.8